MGQCDAGQCEEAGQCEAGWREVVSLSINSCHILCACVCVCVCACVCVCTEREGKRGGGEECFVRSKEKNS